MKNLRKGLAAGTALALALPATWAHAQSAEDTEDAVPVYSMDAVTSSAERTEKRAVDSLAPVSVRKGEDLKRWQSSTLEDLMRGIPGVTTNVSPGGGPGAKINIRGLEDFGRVNVMVDGTRQNFQRSGHSENTMVFVAPHLIEQVDVVRGPSATVYGSGAIGGVVNFKTKDAADMIRPGASFGGSVTAGVGSNADERRGSVSAYGMVDWVDVVFAGSYLTRDDYDAGTGETVENSGWDQRSGLAKLTLTPDSAHQVRFSAMRNEFDYDSGTTVTDELETTANTYKAEYRYTPADIDAVDLTANLYYTTTKQEETRLNGADAGRETTVEVRTPGVDLFNTSRFALGGTDHALTYGVDGFKDFVDAERAGGPLDFTPSGDRRVYGAFVQDEIDLTESLSVVGAVRFDDYRLNGGGVNAEDNAVSPKLTVGYDLWSGITVYGSWARAFRAPAITETLINGTHPPPASFKFRPNPDLKPETAENWELGLNVDSDGLLTKDDRLRVKASVYRSSVDDYIDEVFDMAFTPIGMPDWANSTYGYENIAEASLHGAELEVFYDAGLAYAALALNRARGKNDITGEKLSSGLGDKATLTLGVRERDRGLDAGWRLTGRRDLDVAHVDDPGDAADDPAGGYLLHSAFVTYTPPELDEALTLRLTVDNIFDATYRQTLAAEEPEAGRTFTLSGTLRF